jgi:hypothetical protein
MQIAIAPLNYEMADRDIAKNQFFMYALSAETVLSVFAPNKSL